MTWWTQLTTVTHADPHIRRRGRLLAVILLSMLALASLFTPVSLLGPAPVMGTSLIAISIAIFLTCLVLARRGLVTAA